MGCFLSMLTYFILYLCSHISCMLYFSLFTGVMIGVLMEEEVPLGLEIIGKCVEQNMMGRRPFKMRKVIFSSILRMVVGYLFLTCLFLTVIQENDVLNIFFDVLALEFVEKLDDILHSLLKRVSILLNCVVHLTCVLVSTYSCASFRDSLAKH